MGVAFRRLRELPRTPQSLTWGLLGAAGLTRVFIVPHLVITMYMGYMLTGNAISAGRTFRYGAGAQVLWRSVLWVFPTDHASVLMLHSILASLTLVWWAAILVRAGFRSSGIPFVILLLGFTPMLLWSETSDSLTVPVLFWTLGSALLAQEYLSTRKARYLAGAVVWLALAGHTRPEQVFFGPLLLLTILAFQDASGGLKDRLRAPILAWVSAAIGYVALVGPQIHLSFYHRTQMMQRDSWPRQFGFVLRYLWEFLRSSQTNAILDQRMVAAAVLPLALVALFVTTRENAKRFRRGLVAVGLAWMSFYYIDLSSASAPRLHAVMLVPALIIVADLLSDLWTAAPHKKPWLGRVAALACVVAVTAGSISTAGYFWQPTNERQEDSFFREALAEIPPQGRFVLLRVMNDDRDGDADYYTHFHHPDYLIRDRGGSIVSLSGYTRDPAAFASDPVFYYQGMRCFSTFRSADTPAPETYFRPACRAMHEQFELDPVLERTVLNYGDFGLTYYSTQPDFELGLYRVVARRKPDNPAPPVPSNLIIGGP